MRSVKGTGKLLQTSLRLVATAAGVLAVMFQCATARAQGSPALQITSPADGAVVHPGDTVTVVVTPAAGAAFQYVALVGDPTVVPPDLVLASAPFQFTFTAPTGVSDAGSYRMVPLGVVGPDEIEYSAGVRLDVEPAVPVSAIAVSRPSLTFVRAGEYLPLFVTGHFSDGSTTDSTHSTQISYTSSDANVATVTSSGVVTDSNFAGVGLTPLAGFVEGVCSVLGQEGPLLSALGPKGWPVIFAPQQSDAIVPWLSQLDGQQANSFTADGVIHSDSLESLGFAGPGELSSPAVAGYVIEALNIPVTSAQFTLVP